MWGISRNRGRNSAVMMAKQLQLRLQLLSLGYQREKSTLDLAWYVEWIESSSFWKVTDNSGSLVTKGQVWNIMLDFAQFQIGVQVLLSLKAAAPRKLHPAISSLIQNHIAQYFKSHSMVVTSNFVTPMKNNAELRIFWYQNHIDQCIATYLKSHTMLVTGNLVTSMIHYVELRNFWYKIT